MTAIDFTKGNAKLGPNVWTWSRPYGITCPDTCPLLGISKPCDRHRYVTAGCSDCIFGCYADADTRFRMDATYEGALRRLGIIPPIESLCADDIFRLHVSGDFKLPGDSQDADADYIEGIRAKLCANADAVAFTYTAGWRQWETELMPLRNLMTINASCASAVDVADATAAGWRVAYHGEDVTDTTYHIIADMRLLVCPQQRKRVVSCEDCRACWTPSRRYTGVAFIAH